MPGSFWTEVYSINAKGEIVGAYEDADGVHGVLASACGLSPGQPPKPGLHRP